MATWRSLPLPKLLPGALIAEDLWVFLRSHASMVEFQVCIPGKQQPTMQAWEVCKVSGVGCRLLPLVCVSSGISKRGA